MLKRKNRFILNKRSSNELTLIPGRNRRYRGFQEVQKIPGEIGNGVRSSCQNYQIDLLVFSGKGSFSPFCNATITAKLYYITSTRKQNSRMFNYSLYRVTVNDGSDSQKIKVTGKVSKQIAIK